MAWRAVPSNLYVLLDGLRIDRETVVTPHTHIVRNREIGRDRKRETERERGREIEKEIGRETER